MSRHRLYNQMLDMAIPAGGHIYAEGTGAPSNATVGYAKGCRYRRTDGASGTTIYINYGTYASSLWEAVTSASVGNSLDLGSDGVAGTLDIFADAGTGRKIILTATDTGANSRTLSITNRALAQSTALGIPDPGAAGEFVLTNSAHQVIVNANGSDRTVSLGGNLTIGSTIVTVGALATAGPVSFIGTDTAAITVPAGGSVVTLPASGTLLTDAGNLTATTSPSWTLDSDANTGKLVLRVNGAPGTDNIVYLQAPTTTQEVTLTLPNVASDTLVSKTSTDIFTNKTLTTPAINGMTTAAAANNFDLSTGTGFFKTPTGICTLYGNIAVNGAGLTFDFSASGGIFKTSTGVNTLGGNVVIPANKTFDASASNGTFKTSTGTNTLGGDVVMSATKTFDASASNGTFKTSTGTHTVGGDVNIAAGKNLSLVAGAGAIQVNGTTSGGIRILPPTIGTSVATLTMEAQTVATDFKLPDLNVATAQLVAVNSDNTVKIVSGVDTTVTLTGDVTRVGAHALTLRTSGATDLTLPTSGTVLTTDPGNMIGTTSQQFDIDSDNLTGHLILKNTEGGANKSYTLQSPTATQDVVMTLPDIATDTLMSKTSADVMTNKTLTTPTLTTPVINGATTAVAANNFALNTGTGTFSTPQGTFTHYGNVAVNGAGLTFNYSGSAGIFTTSSGANTLSGDVTISGAKAFTTGSGAVTIKGATTFDAGIVIDYAGVGAGSFDMSDQTGTFKTSTDTNTLGGNVVISGIKTFTTGTGAVTIKGATTFDAGLAIDYAAGGAGSFDMSDQSGTFQTSTNTNTLNGNVVISGVKTLTTGTGLTTISGNMRYAASVDIDTAGAGTGTFNYGAQSGAFTTSTGANTLSGDVTISGAKTLTTGTGITTISGDTKFLTGTDIYYSAGGDGSFDLSTQTGAFLTSSGTNTFKGNVVIDGAKTLTTGTGLTTVSGSMRFAAGVDIDTAGIGAGTFDLSLQTGIFKTSSNTNTLMGDVVITGAKTFTTGSGLTTVNGNMRFLAGVDVDYSGAGDGLFDMVTQSGIFRTSTGTNTLSGDVVITGAKALTTGTGAVTVKGNTTFDANVLIDYAGAGTGAFDMSDQSGTFKTSTDTNTLSGHVSIAANKNLTLAQGTGYVYITAATTGGFKILPVAGQGNLLTMSIGALGAPRTITTPDPGADNTYFAATAETNGKIGVADLSTAAQDLIATVGISIANHTDGTGLATITVKDAAGNTLAQRSRVRTWISASDFGAPAVQTGFTVTTGTLLATVAANADLELISPADGILTVDINHGSAETVYVMAEVNGRIYSGSVGITGP